MNDYLQIEYCKIFSLNCFEAIHYNSMYIQQFTKKQLFGSIDKTKLPGNLTDYTCELVIEDYKDGPITTQNRFFKFTPKQGQKVESFMIEIDEVLPTKNLVHSYKMAGKEGQPNIVVQQKQEFKIQASIKLTPKPASNLEVIEQSEDEVYPEDSEMRVLELRDSEVNQDSSSQSKCIEPSDGDKGRIKAELIQYLHVEDHRQSKLKEIKKYLMEKGFKIAQNRVKSLLSQVCKTGDKRFGYVLRDHYIEEQDYQRKNGRKKVKE